TRAEGLGLGGDIVDRERALGVLLGAPFAETAGERATAEGLEVGDAAVRHEPGAIGRGDEVELARWRTFRCPVPAGCCRQREPRNRFETGAVERRQLGDITED